MAARCRIVFLSFLLWWLPASPARSQSASPTLNPDSLFFEGLRLYRAGASKEARVRFRAVLDRAPLYHDARVLYGRILAWDEDYRGAVSQFDSVLFYQPGNREARFAKAQVLAWSGRYRSAADILLVLTEEVPASAPYWLQLAHVYLWGRSPLKAVEYYEKAYLRDPDSPETLRGLARAHRQLRSNDLSLLWYLKLLDKVPGDQEALGEILRLSFRSDHEIQIQGSYESFTVSGFKEHTIGQLEYYLTLNENWKPFLHFSRISKFSADENRMGIGTYATIDYSISVLAQVLVVPDARIAPEFDGLAELSVPVGSGFEVVGGYRYMKFDSLHVHVPAPGLTLYLSDHSWVTARGYFGFASDNTTSGAFTAIASFRPHPLATVRLGGFTGNETIRATTFREVASLKSSGVFVGVRGRVSRFFALDGQYQYTSRSLSSNSHLILFSFSFLF